MRSASPFGEIDEIKDGILWEEKSATGAYGEARGPWIGHHVVGKFAKHLVARQYIPGHENAAIGFRFTSGGTDEFRGRVEAAIQALRARHPTVTIHLAWSA